MMKKSLYFVVLGCVLLLSAVHADEAAFPEEEFFDDALDEVSLEYPEGSDGNIPLSLRAVFAMRHFLRAADFLTDAHEEELAEVVFESDSTLLRRSGSVARVCGKMLAHHAWSHRKKYAMLLTAIVAYRNYATSMHHALEGIPVWFSGRFGFGTRS